MKTTVLMMPSHTRALAPILATPEPINPPIRACDELVGKPWYQVMRSHMQAAINVAAITLRSTIAGSMMPFPTVEATFN